MIGAYKGVKQIYNYSSGYVTALMENDASNNLLFSTDGYIVRSNILNDYDILFIDEAHEFNSNIEELLYMAKKRLENDANFKVIILSATIKEQIEKFKNYFSEFTLNYTHYEGTTYPVELHNFNNYQNLDLIDTINSQVNQNFDTMVFLPTKSSLVDIKELYIQKYPNSNIEILLLSSESEDDVRDKLFNKGDKTRLWLATNVAQAGLTPINVKCIILTGYKVQNMCDKNGNEGVEIVKISKDDAIQQYGRTGRLSKGKAIWCADYDYNSCPLHNTPEIQRMSLDKVYLGFINKGLQMENIQLLHQPDRNNITLANKSLTDLQLIENNEITDMGRQCLKLPLAPKFAKGVIIAGKYKLTNLMIHIMALLECSSPLLKKDYNYLNGIKATFGEEILSKYSDLLTMLKIFITYANDYNKQYVFNKKTLSLINENIQMIYKNISQKEKDDASNNIYIFHALCESFYKNLWIQNENNSEIYTNPFTNECYRVSNKSFATSSKYIIAFEQVISTIKGSFTVLNNFINIDEKVVQEVYHKEIKTKIVKRIDEQNNFVKYEIQTLFDKEINKTEVFDREESDYKYYSMYFSSMSLADYKNNNEMIKLYTNLYNRTKNDKYKNYITVEEHFILHKIDSIEKYNQNPILYLKLVKKK